VTNDFDHEHGVSFQQYKTRKHKGVQPHDYFSHMIADRDDAFYDSLDENLGSIKPLFENAAQTEVGQNSRFFLLKIILFIFLDCFDVLMLKIIFLKKILF
jgi:hypothetical protein